MDESSLRAQLLKLEACRSSLHSSFRLWEWVVVAGIVLELVVLVREYWAGWSAYFRATIRLPEKPSTFLFVVGTLGVVMVAGGISKELGIDSKIEEVETQIRAVNGQLFGIVSQEAQSASDVSDLAKRKADAVTTRVDGLTKKLDTAEGRITQAEGSAGQLSKDILDVEAELSDRVFSDQVGAGNRLSVFAPVSAVIEYLPSEECEDCESTAGQIFPVLHDVAKWNVFARPNPDRTAFMEGVIVQVDAAGPESAGLKRAEAGAEALISELNKTHIQARRHAADLNFPLGVVVIRVGKKPNPVIQRMFRDWKKRMQEETKQPH